MTTAAVTTVCREAPKDNPFGYVATVDLDRWEVTRRCAMVKPRWFREDTNPRGGFRGATGLGFSDTRGWIANYSAVYGFDSSWRLEGVISHPSCANIHDIVAHGDYLWVSSTRNDLVMQFDHSGALVGQLDPLSFEPVRRGLALRGHASGAARRAQIDFRDPRTHRLEDHDNLHLNSLCFRPDGSMLVLFGMCWTRSQIATFQLKEWLRQHGYWEPVVAVNRALLRLLHRKPPLDTEMIARPAKGRGAVVRFQPEGGSRIILTLEGLGVPAHSLLPEADGSVLFADTSSGDLVRFCPERATVLSRSHVSDRFLRGLHQLDAETLLAGDQNRLLVVRKQQGGGEVVERSLQISDDPNEAIYGIHRLPPAFGPMPPDLFADAPAF